MRIFPYLSGYVQIDVVGDCPEKWINIAIRRGLRIWDLERKGEDRFVLCIPLKQYRKHTRSICKKSACRTRVLQRAGVPFLLRKLKYRKALAVTCFLACLLTVFLSSLVWSVEILPGKGVGQESILAAEKILWASGVRPGVFLQSVPKREVAAAILQNQKDLSWVLVRRRGTKIYVELESSVQTAPKPPSDAPCDLVAPKDFELVKCTVYRGTPSFKVGDIVHRGQVVVAGLEAGQCAQADVEGRTWYTVSVPIPTEIEMVEETGRSHSAFALFVLGLRIPLPSKAWLPWGKKDFGENCRTTSRLSYWSLPGGTQLPLGIISVEKKETRFEKRPAGEEEALDYARFQGTQLLDDKVPDTATVLATTYTIALGEDGTRVYKITAECIEKINMNIVDKL